MVCIIRTTRFMFSNRNALLCEKRINAFMNLCIWRCDGNGERIYADKISALMFAFVVPLFGFDFDESARAEQTASLDARHTTCTLHTPSFESRLRVGAFENVKGPTDSKLYERRQRWLRMQRIFLCARYLIHEHHDNCVRNKLARSCNMRA